MKKVLTIIGVLLLAFAATAAFGSDHVVAYHIAALGQHDLSGLMPGLAAVGMTTLAADQPREYFLGDFDEYPMIATDIIYKGAAVGDNGSGYARPLVAGDPFRGFAELKTDNSAGAAGDQYVRCRTRGSIKLAISALAITDVGKDVYASDDNTFTLTQSTNTRIGYVKRWIATGYGVIEFDVTNGAEAELVDSTGGVVDGTLADVGPAFSQATLNANFADLAAKVNYLIRRQGN